MWLAPGVAVVRRGAWACVLPLAFGAALALGGASATAAEPCPNEKVREESNLIPGTARHYSQELPECRAYEMVSPLEKGGHDADTGARTVSARRPALGGPGGETVGWRAEGRFRGRGKLPRHHGDSENPLHLAAHVSGWETSSFAPPRSFLNIAFIDRHTR